MKYKVCQQQNRVAIDLLKKAETVTRTRAPMSMD